MYNKSELAAVACVASGLSVPRDPQWIENSMERFKPGSHMPPKYPRRGRGYCLQYYSDIWGHNAAGNKKHRRSLPSACLRSRTRVNFAGTPAVKTETWSHIPPKCLRCSRRNCLRYSSDIWGNKAASNKKHRRSLPPALRSWTWVNFAGMRAVKTDKALVAGDFCFHIGTVSQAVPAAMS